jgi:iron(III) transport system substrate-binding protein
MRVSVSAPRAGRFVAPLVLILASLSGTGPANAQGEVNIYSSREPQLIEPLLKAFTEKTGIKTNVLFVRDGLNERVAAEGQNSPADLMLTVDISRLVEAKAAGITQPVNSPVLTSAIPQSYRDREGHWFALTLRARVVYASKDRVPQNSITYEELADPKWKGRICSRSGQHAYNTSLFASMIAHKGEAATEEWLKGLKANLAQKPSGGDREQARDVYAGKCDLAIGNTYYMALMLKNPEQQAWAQSVKVLFPNAADRGTHVNVSGAALLKHAPNRANAIKLMEFLVSPEAQRIYAEGNNEYPVNPEVEPSAVVKSWGTLKADPLPLEEIAKHRKKASELVDKVRFDSGPTS